MFNTSIHPIKRFYAINAHKMHNKVPNNAVCPNFIGRSGRCIICEQTQDIRIVIDHHNHADFVSQLKTCKCDSHKYCIFYDTSHELVARELI